MHSLQETEVKFLNIDKKEILKKLKSLKAKKIFEGDIHTTYYDTKNKSLEKQNKTVRLRIKKSKTKPEIELTFKKRLSSLEAKVMKEQNFIIKDIKTANAFLKSINLIQSGTIPDKHRISYRLKNLQFELDTYKNCPTFLEIESDNINSLKQAVELLSLDFKDAKIFTANQLLKYFKKNNLINSKNK